VPLKHSSLPCCIAINSVIIISIICFTVLQTYRLFRMPAFMFINVNSMLNSCLLFLLLFLYSEWSELTYFITFLLLLLLLLLSHGWIVTRHTREWMNRKLRCSSLMVTQQCIPTINYHSVVYDKCLSAQLHVIIVIRNVITRQFKKGTWIIW